MDLEYAIVCAVVFIVGILLGVLIHKIRWNKKMIFGGYMLLDHRINSTQAENIEPYNRSKWQNYKYIWFKVDYEGPEKPGFYNRVNKFGKVDDSE